MAFTIRQLSAAAETTLKEILKKNPAFFKTKTAVINWVLEQHYELREEIKELKAENEKLKDDNFMLNAERRQIKDAIKRMIKYAEK